MGGASSPGPWRRYAGGLGHLAAGERGRENSVGLPAALEAEMIKHDNGYAIIGAEINGPTLVFAFAGLGECAKESYWADDYMRKCGFSFVSFVPKSPNWYPGEAFALSLEIEAMIERLTDRVTYGYSMGGHAALKSASLFKAKRVVAICPQYSIDTDVVQDHRYGKYWTEETGTHHMMHHKTDARRMIFFDDSYVPDIRHMERIAETGPFEVMSCRGADHDIWGALAKRQLVGMNGVLTSAIRGELTPELFAEQYNRPIA